MAATAAQAAGGGGGGGVGGGGEGYGAAAAAARGGGGGSGGGAEDGLYTELWNLCAGPLVTLPRVKDKVYYFPQGHLEQVEALTNQVAEKHMQMNLPWKILCEVLNVELKAETDKDDVYALLTLLPITERPEENRSSEEMPAALPAAPVRPRVYSFCKTLTASDRSTHGGFLVPRRHAEECLPPLDMRRQHPSQELVAKDLHDVEWRFRHVYRGQPPRHLLQSCWGAFVSTKQVVVGDAFIFLRGENGELRVGVRHAMRRQGNVPHSVVSSHNMHVAVLATASHAVTSRGMFTVHYKPRTSPAEFVVPCDRYMESLKRNYSIGMRFKMRFEGEEAPEQRLTGTIVGMSDSDPVGWPESKWRSLKVRWDEVPSIPRPEWVSPWQIEPAVRPILHGSIDNIAPPVQATLHPMDSPQVKDAGGSSSSPLLVDNIVAEQNLMDNQDSLLLERGKRGHSQLISMEGEQEPPAKKKLDSIDATVDVSSMPIPSPPAAISSEDPGEACPHITYRNIDDNALSQDLGIIWEGGSLEPQPSPDMSLTDVEEFCRDFSQRSYNLTKIPPQIFTSSMEQQPEDPSCSGAVPVLEATLGMIEQISMEAAKQIIAVVLKGVDSTTLRNPSSPSILRDASSNLSGHFASTSMAKGMLDELATICEQVQKTHSELDESTRLQDQALNDARCALAAQEEACEAISEEIISVEQQAADVSSKIAELNIVLQGLEQKKERLSQTWSTQDSTVKKLHAELSDAAAKRAEKTNNLQLQATTLGQNADKLLASLEEYSSGSDHQ